VIYNPRTGFTTRKQGQKRPPIPSCETSSRKGVFVVLAISALAIASHGFAQQSNNGSPDGLYTPPDASQSKSTAEKFPSNYSAQSYLSELDPQAERFKHDLEKAEAARQAAASAKRLKYLAASGESILSSWKLGLSERSWIPVLAGSGLLVSLAVGGYVWWSHIQTSKVSRAILLPVKRKSAAKAGSTAKQGKTPERRAA